MARSARLTSKTVALPLWERGEDWGVLFDQMR
jgi:hypothetical protein